MALDRRTRSLDEEGHRKAIHPTEAKGRWHDRRVPIQFGLIAFFLAIPWITIGGRPLLRLDFLERKFSVLGVLFQAHDVPLVFLAVMAFVLAFGLVTALYGRVWCGWACPQTVFIEAVFRRIERWIEGDAYARRRAAASPADAGRLGRAILKWIAYVGATLVITHSFLAIFVGPAKLGEMIRSGPAESPAAFLFMLVSSAVILFDFGWFREQFCIVACPYGRIQSVFQDAGTKTVAYDARRGEPRGAIRAAAAGEGAPKGDCVDCGRCVQACPTGIDIRNGSSQLECIACTGCIDACDDVMKRLRRPLGLIRYASLEELETGKAGRSWSRGRNLAYLGGLALVVVAVAVVGERRTIAMVEVFKSRGEPYAVFDAPGGRTYGNLFVAEIASRSPSGIEVEFALEGAAGDELVMPNNPIVVREGEVLRQPFTIRFRPGTLVDGRREIDVRVTARVPRGNGPGNPGREIQRRKAVLIGPL